MLAHIGEKLQQSVFVDDSAFTAFMNPNDFNYPKARSLFFDLDDLDRHFVTTNYIVFETHQWLRNHYGFEKAQFFLDTVDKSSSLDRLTVISGSAEIESESKQLLIDCPQYKFTLSEAVTAVVMFKFGIRRIFSFKANMAMLSRLNSEIKVIPGRI